MFDLIFSFSSLEHSGLGKVSKSMCILVTYHTMSQGRYGDPLNPWGDIVTIGQAWCVSTPDVSLLGSCRKKTIFFSDNIQKGEGSSPIRNFQPIHILRKSKKLNFGQKCFGKLGMKVLVGFNLEVF